MNAKTLKVKSRTENLSVIRDFVNSAALQMKIPKDIVENIILAVDEACTNIIKHAYNYSSDGDISIKIKPSTSKFIVSVIDNGISFEPEKIPKPDLQKYYRQKRVGGLGIYLMKSLMDDVKYISKPGKYNEVLLTKNIKVVKTNA